MVDGLHDASRISWGKPAADFGPSAAFLRVGRMHILPHPSKPCGWTKLSGHFPHPREYAGQRNARRGAPSRRWRGARNERVGVAGGDVVGGNVAGEVAGGERGFPRPFLKLVVWRVSTGV